MASKRRIRRKQCGSKRRFETRYLAMDCMHSLIRAGKTRGGYLQVYICKFCGGFHFGHAIGKQKGA